MGTHHTKDKGDLGVAKAYADLAAQGYMDLFPATEHGAFDLVAYDGDQFHRVQVKHRAVYRGGVRVDLNSTWSGVLHAREFRHFDPVGADVLGIQRDTTTYSSAVADSR